MKKTLLLTCIAGSLLFAATGGPARAHAVCPVCAGYPDAGAPGALPDGTEPSGTRDENSDSHTSGQQHAPVRQPRTDRRTADDAACRRTGRPDREEPGRSEEPSPQALLRFEDPVFDFGNVARKGGDVSHDFVFRNDGAVPLVVMRAVTSCSCVKASFDKKPVAPGATGVIRVVYQPLKSEPGTFHKVIQIYSNSASERDLLTVSGNAVEGAGDPGKIKIKNDKLKVKN